MKRIFVRLASISTLIAVPACGGVSGSNATSNADGGTGTSSGGASGSNDAGTAPDSGVGDAAVVANVLQCTDGDPEPPASHDELLETFAGKNGTFTDSCDAAGNLVAHRCETVDMGEDFEYYPVATGRVSTDTIDCGGTCADGRCTSGCPEAGTPLTVQEANTAASAPDAGAPTGKIVFVDPASGARYACQFDASISACSGFWKVGATFKPEFITGNCYAAMADGWLTAHISVADNVLQACDFTSCQTLTAD